MTVHKFQIQLDSPIVRLQDVDDLIGKRVEIIVREVEEEAWESNGTAVLEFLEEYASPALFSEITDPVQWQKELRDEWE